jgi:hypothetical protein
VCIFYQLLHHTGREVDFDTEMFLVTWCLSTRGRTLVHTVSLFFIVICNRLTKHMAKTKMPKLGETVENGDNKLSRLQQLLVQRTDSG